MKPYINIYYIVFIINFDVQTKITLVFRLKPNIKLDYNISVAFLKNNSG